MNLPPNEPQSRPTAGRPWAEAPLWLRVLWLAISTPRSANPWPPEWWLVEEETGAYRIGWTRTGIVERFDGQLAALVRTDVAAWQDFLTVGHGQ